MTGFQKARFLAGICVIAVSCKFAFSVVAQFFGEEALTTFYGFPDAFHAAFVGIQLFTGLSTLGVSPLVSARYGLSAKTSALKRLSFGLCIRGLTDLVNLLSPRQMHSEWFGSFDMAITVLFFVTVFFYSSASDGDDAPKKRRKAQWPAWVKARWSPALKRHEAPQPSPQPTR